MAVVCSNFQKFNNTFPTPISTDLTGDYYDLLEISDFRWVASQKKILTAYRTVSLKYHPDKQNSLTEDEKQKAHVKYVKIKEAYETLSNTEKRSAYDSSLAFDDTIPTLEEAKKGDFFALFAPVFRRNSIFSKIKPVPLLGDCDKAVGEVLKFYDFWRGFRSWRDFSYKAKYNLEEAENREERRWMTRENKTEISGLIKAEKKRMNKLVEVAYSSDPRVAKYYGDKRNERDMKRRLKRLEKQREAERRTKQIELAKSKALEKEAKAKKDKEDKKAEEKEKLQNTKNAILEISQDLEISTEIQDNLLDKSTPTQLIGMLDQLKAERKPRNKKQRAFDFYKFYCGVIEKKGLAKNGSKSSAKWNGEELSNLIKAVSKFPGGTLNRWDKITALLNRSGCTKSKEELIAKVSQIKGNEKDAKKSKRAEKWTGEQRLLLERGLALTKGECSGRERWLKVAGIVPDKNAKECLVEFKRLKGIS